MANPARLQLWASLLIAGTLALSAGLTAPSFAHGCRVNGFNGHNGCRINGFNGHNGCRINGFNGHNGCRGFLF